MKKTIKKSEKVNNDIENVVKEFNTLDLLSRRVSAAKDLMDINDVLKKQIYTDEWIEKNILKVDSIPTTEKDLVDEFNNLDLLSRRVNLAFELKELQNSKKKPFLNVEWIVSKILNMYN